MCESQLIDIVLRSQDSFGCHPISAHHALGECLLSPENKLNEDCPILVLGAPLSSILFEYIGAIEFRYYYGYSCQITNSVKVSHLTKRISE